MGCPIFRAFSSRLPFSCAHSFNFGVVSLDLPIIFCASTLRAGFGVICRWYLYHQYGSSGSPVLKVWYFRGPFNFFCRKFGGSDVHHANRTQLSVWQALCWGWLCLARARLVPGSDSWEPAGHARDGVSPSRGKHARANSLSSWLINILFGRINFFDIKFWVAAPRIWAPGTCSTGIGKCRPQAD